MHGQQNIKKIGSLLSTFRVNLYVPSSRTVWLLKMGSRDCPETSVGNYSYTLRAIPKDHRAHSHRTESPWSLTKVSFIATAEWQIWIHVFCNPAAKNWWDGMIPDRAPPACEVYLPNMIWGSHTCKYEHYCPLVYDIVQFGTHVKMSQGGKPHQRGLKPKIYC